MTHMQIIASIRHVAVITLLSSAGRLDHAELCSLVQSIPDLAPEEQKFIIGTPCRDNACILYWL